MDLLNDKPPKAVVKQKLFRGEDAFKADLVTIEKQGAALSKIKARATSKYKSGTTQSTTSHSSSPSFIKKSDTADASVSARAQSAERKRPNTPSLKFSSAPSSPLRRPALPSPPNSKPSTPPSSSACDGIAEKQNPSRRAFGGRTTDGLWPSMRSLSSSFHSESFIFASKKDRPVRSASLDHALKNATKATSERKRSPLKGRNTSEQSSNRNVNATSPRVEEDRAILSTNPSRTLSLPVVSLRRPSSPNNASVISSSASRRTPSPSSSRPSPPFISSNNAMMNHRGASSLLPSHILDVRKRIKGADVEDIYQLRLLYNRELQWRFVNSQAEVTLATHKIAAERICNNVWNVISELQYSVTMEKINIESLKQEMKVEMLLKEQAPYLEDWIALEGEYFGSLYGTMEALKASMLRLPVISGARVDARAVKNAVSSAIDIMQAMGSSVCNLISRVEDTKRLLCQLSAVTVKEKAMLDECRVLLAATAGMQVEECSLRAHILQLRQDMHILG